MFKETYKAANDDIKANDELIAAVLSGKRRRRSHSIVYKYSSIAAAAAIVAVSVSITPAVNKRVTQDTAGEAEISSTTAPETDRTDQTMSAIESAMPESNTAADTDVYRQNETSVQPPSVKQKETAKIEHKSPIAADAAIAEDTAAVSESAAKKEINTYTKSVVLNINDTDYGGGMTSIGDYGGAIAEGGYTAVQWSMEDYFEYLGENILEKLSLPEDFSYVGAYEMHVSVDENNQPMQDSAIFPYEGDNGRYVTVITSKNTLTASSYIEDERYVKSDIEGKDAVVIGEGEKYKSYMINEDVSHIVTSDGMSEDELGNLLVSIGG